MKYLDRKLLQRNKSVKFGILKSYLQVLIEDGKLDLYLETDNTLHLLNEVFSYSQVREYLFKKGFKFSLIEEDEDESIIEITGRLNVRL